MVKTHKVFSEINEIAGEYEADLIVMGSHGVAGVKEVFVGSNTEKVVRSADIPVLVIKNRMKEFNIQNTVFVTDLQLESLNSFIRARVFLNYSTKNQKSYSSMYQKNFLALKK